MNIAYISYEFPPETPYGGIGTYTRQVSATMAARGHHVEVFSCSHQADDYNRILDTGVVVHRVKAGKRKEFCIRLMDIFSERHRLVQFDLVESPEYGAEGIEVKKKYPKLPMIVKLHAPAVLINTINRQFKPVSLKSRIKQCARRSRYNKHNDMDYVFTTMADGVCAPSAALAGWIQQEWGINNIAVVPNVFIPPSTHLQIPVGCQSKRITFFGKLNVLKGMVALTMAIPQVLKKHPDATFRLIGLDGDSPNGAGSMRQYMTTQLKGYSDRLEFTGFIYPDKLHEMLKDTAIVVLPSLWENYPNACLEAMAAGRPVVGSGSGGMKEILMDGKGGYIVQPGNYTAIAAALIRLLDDPALAGKMGAYNREQVTSLAVTSEQTTIAYYERLIEKKAVSVNG